MGFTLAKSLAFKQPGFLHCKDDTIRGDQTTWLDITKSDTNYSVFEID